MYYNHPKIIFSNTKLLNTRIPAIMLTNSEYLIKLIKKNIKLEVLL